MISSSMRGQPAVAQKIEGPDFICIGLPRAATGWLYDQLLFHPDFWMPPIKEIGYLSRKTGSFDSCEIDLMRLENPEPVPARRQDKGRKGLIARRADRERDCAFYAVAKDLHGRPRNIQGYKELFAPKGQRISGDVTPGYCRIGDDFVSKIGAKLPGTKVLLIVRDPVARIWSEMCRSRRRLKVETGLLDDPEAVRQYLAPKGALRKRIPRPARIAARWKKQASQMPFRHFMFDDIVDDAEGTFREIVAYLGGDPAKRADQFAPEFNRKSSKRQFEMSDDVRAVLAELLRDDLKECAAAFGGHAEKWAEKYGVA